MSQKPRPSKTRGKGFVLRSLPEESTVDASGLSAPPEREPFDNLGDLPHGYGLDTIFLVAQEPKWLFTYWDIDINRHPGGAAYLRYHYGDGTLAGEIEVPFETRNWYIPVEQASTEYFVELGYYRGETWNLIARSISVTTPPETMAAAETFDYATIPFHLSFQRLLDHLQSARDAGENLVETVSRLQSKGDFGAFGVGAMGDLLTPDQQALLRVLMGPELLTELSSVGSSAGEIEARIRAYLEEQLSSGAAGSEILSSFREAAATLSSGEFLASYGGETSWEIAALSSWAAGAIASWTAAGYELSSLGSATSWTGAAGSSAETSWGAAASTSWAGAGTTSWSAVSSASWAQTASSAALASWLQAGLSSWLLAASSSGGAVELSSWLQSTQSSWLQGLQSSWAQAALTSWSNAEFSSWFSAEATTSWGGASETLSSAFAAGGRDFFMHVNAEVIFYGGTDPRAKVTIAGQPIALTPDGNFRYHFVFPNADYEIPIVALSPDGVESRAATLSFHRGTAKVGVVTDTPQPPLGAPIGQR